MPPAVASVRPGRAPGGASAQPARLLSLVLFSTLVVLSLFAEVLSNDKPLLVRYDGQFYFPLVRDYPETTFGGDFQTQTDYLDPSSGAAHQGRQLGLYPPNPYGPKTLNYFAKEPNPSRPRATTCSAPTTAAATCWRS
jgi:microcin C transport system permease protein